MELVTSLDYPYDVSIITRKKRKIKAALLTDKIRTSLKIAILGGSTTEELKNQLELFLLRNGIEPTFFESGYAQYYEQSLFPSAAFKEFDPDLIYVYINNKNLPLQKGEFRSKPLEFINSEVTRIEQMFTSLKNHFNKPIIINNFEQPLERPFGNYEGTSEIGVKGLIDQINLKLSELARAEAGLYICDLSTIASCVGLNQWYDKNLWYQYKYAISYTGITHLSHNISTLVNNILGKRKKCLVLDLDHTLWGGIIGDDGADAITLGPGNPMGEAYQDFQRYIKALKESGIILAICSKNNEKIALEGLLHENSILSEDDFSILKINWDPKSKNIVEIAEQLNIGLDSMVFIDDNPAERDIVRSQVPEIVVPEVEANPMSYIQALDKEGYFSISSSLSKEDVNRVKYYIDNVKRDNQKLKFSDYGDYLKSLEMEAEIFSVSEKNIERVTQLVNKTDQFNLTTKRYTRNEIESFLGRGDDSISLCARLGDKYGDNGLVSIIFGSIKNNILHVDLWVMSCRVINRQLEFALFDHLADILKSRNIKELRGYYFKTPKNELVSEHYQKLGFKLLERNDKNTVWKFDLFDKKAKLNENIKVNI